MVARFLNLGGGSYKFRKKIGMNQSDGLEVELSVWILCVCIGSYMCTHT